MRSCRDSRFTTSAEVGDPGPKGKSALVIRRRKSLPERDTDKIPIAAGLPALQGGEPGQVRKEAATAVFCKCRGPGSPHLLPPAPDLLPLLTNSGQPSHPAYSLRFKCTLP